MELTMRERRLLARGLNKGYISLADFYLEYKSVISARETIKRFLMAGLMRQGLSDTFEINNKLIIETLCFITNS